jgi:benzil reductase ((S)-benzoin forming)
MKRYIITGASRGIGKALALHALTQDAIVHTVARHTSAALEKAAGSSPARLTQHSFDLSRVERVPELAQHILGSDGAVATTGDGPADPGAQARPDAVILINNAGMLEPIGPAVELSPTDLATHVSVNLTALMQLTASVLSLTQEQARAGQASRTVVNIGSGAARRPYAGWAPYCSTKAAVEMFTRVLAAEHADEPGFRAVTVAPGVVDTEMQALIRETEERRFPDRPKFIELKESGKLYTTEYAAELVMRAVFDPDIESGESVDVRKRYG